MEIFACGIYIYGDILLAKCKNDCGSIAMGDIDQCRWIESV